MTYKPANFHRMNAAVDRWISEAQGRADGARLLRQKATWMGHQIRMLGDARVRTPENMVGIEVADAMDAQAKLQRAARQLAGAAQKVAA